MSYNYNFYPQSPQFYSPQQQRLAMMEQQYPQFSAQNMNGMTPPLSLQPQGLKGRVVTSIDEVRGYMIDLDGSVYVFPDPGNNKIYTKQFNPMTGSSEIKIYSDENARNQNGGNQNQVAQYGALDALEDSDFVSMDDFKQLSNKVDRMYKELYSGEENEHE